MPHRKWSQDVTEHSDALDIQTGIFASDDPRQIARSLKKSAEASHRRKAEPYRSAMSMLVFFINRAGKNLPAKHKRVLEVAKDELRALYGRPPAKRPAASAAPRKTTATQTKRATSSTARKQTSAATARKRRAPKARTSLATAKARSTKRKSAR